MFQHELGDRLMPAFDSGSPVPYSDVNLRDHTAHAPRWGPDSSTSEVTTIQLEFIDLSRQTGNPKYEVGVTTATRFVVYPLGTPNLHCSLKDNKLAICYNCP